jgi:hypothetical protein
MFAPAIPYRPGAGSLRTWAGILGLLLTLAAGAAEPEDMAGKVELVNGQVRLEDGAQVGRPIRVGEPVHAGESIVTGADGEVHLEMADGGTIAVRPNTRLRIAEYRARGDDQDRSILNLLAGGFRSITGWIGKFNPRGYQVRTPTATIGVRGTDHEPQVIPEGSSEGEPGTYDKVNAGSTYIESEGSVLEVPAQRAAFVPLAGPGLRPLPRLLERVPPLFRPTLNEHLLERRHEAIQHLLEQRRFERRQFLERRISGQPPAGPRLHPGERLGDRPLARPAPAERRALLEQRRGEALERRPLPSRPEMRPELRPQQQAREHRLPAARTGQPGPRPPAGRPAGRD